MFFLIIILILHFKVVVNDISAFYLPHFTFFISFEMFLARFACHMAKMNGEKKRWKKYKISKKKKIYKNPPKKVEKKISGSELKIGRFSRSFWFQPGKSNRGNC